MKPLLSLITGAALLSSLSACVAAGTQNEIYNQVYEYPDALYTQPHGFTVGMDD